MQTPNKLLVIYKPQTSNTLRHYFPYLLAYEQQKWVSGEPIPSLAVSLASVELRLHPIGRYPPLANCRRHGVSRPAKGAARGWLRTAPNLSTPPDLLVRGPCQPRGFALFTRPLGGGGRTIFCLWEGCGVLRDWRVSWLRRFSVWGGWSFDLLFGDASTGSM